MENIRTILESLGFQLNETSKEYRCKPIYRESGNATSLRINKSTGNWIDFGACVGGSFIELIKLTLKLSSIEEATEYIKQKHNLTFTTPPKEKPLITTPTYFKREELDLLSPVHTYWVNRGISEPTLEEFLGGICIEGKMKGRYVFPIFDQNKAIVGFVGRRLHEQTYIKWKIIGQKNNFSYPAFKNYELLKELKSVILVESIGDMLSLWDAGIKNVLVTFGVEIQRGIINILLRINPKNIYFSFNNDQDNNFIGNKAAENSARKLLRYFNPEILKVALPPKKDFNEMSKIEILDWYQKL